MSEDRYFLMHDYDVLADARDPDSFIGTERHAHSVAQNGQHQGNWGNPNHDGVPIGTWKDLKAEARGAELDEAPD